MRSLKQWQLTEKHNNGVTLTVDDQHKLSIYVLENHLMRVLIQKNGELSLDRTWSIAPKEDVPFEGRDRLSLSGFSCPQFKMTEGEILTIETDRLKVEVHQPLYLAWYSKNPEDSEWQFLVRDRRTGAYELGNKTYTEISHYQERYNDEAYYGLGEKAGNLNRAGRRFEMRNVDAMGYDAQTTDPLYKHMPFIITRRNNLSFGIFYDNLATCQIDLGNELDNYHAYYRKYVAEAGDLDYYFLAGPKVLDVTKQFVKLTGKTIFAPKWSLGYSGSTMHYTDAPNAQEQLQEFLKLCKEHAIPCDSFQMSSGYTSIGHKRYVFHWNVDKFPNIEKFTHAFHKQEIRLVANIKPCLLHDHPQYEYLQKEALFIQDSEKNQPEISVFWDDKGSHVDFTNPKAVQWWQDNVTSALLDKGIDATWNDNNEYEIWDRDARCHGFGKEIPVKLIRPVMPLLMMRASKEAQEKFLPKERPYLISRSGCAGMQRYVQTWSGDNRTSWNNLKYNIKMGVGMSLSGLYNVGHDVGGFSGNRPDPELFVRWVQNGVMHPRFTIHSWNDDKTVNEPWMFPEVTPIIREAISLRYQLLPYFYNLLWQAHVADEPMLRPTFLDYEDDPNTFMENDDFFIGRDLLVASVVEENARTRKVYLPRTPYGWYDFHAHTWFAGGQNITLEAPLERLPLLAAAGSIIPMAKPLSRVNSKNDDKRFFMIFPQQGSGTSTGTHFEDDGVSHAWKNKTGHLLLEWTINAHLDRIELIVEPSGEYRPEFHEIECLLPKNEVRPLYINGILTNILKI